MRATIMGPVPVLFNITLLQAVIVIQQQIPQMAHDNGGGAMQYVRLGFVWEAIALKIHRALIGTEYALLAPICVVAGVHYLLWHGVYSFRLEPITM